MEIFPNWTAIPIVFLLVTLVFILNRTFFRPLGKALEERHRLIEGAQHEAEDIRKASQDRIQEFDKRMRSVRLEAGQIVAAAKQEGQSQKSSILTSKRDEVQKIISQARVEIQQKTNEARLTLEMQAQEFAYQIASQILSRSVKPKK